MDEADRGWEFWEDVEIDEHRPIRRWTRVALIVAVAALIGALALFVPRWYDGLTVASRPGGGSGPPAVADAPPASQAGSPSTVPTTAFLIPESMTGASQTEASKTVATPTTSSVQRVLVSSLQVVPALPGVVVDIDGQQFVTDAQGTIDVPAARQHGTATVVGIADRPSLRRVGFLQWADGDRSAARSLDTVTGPVAQIGVTLSYRVVVQAPGDGAAVVRFTSEVGPFSLVSGTTQWVPAAQAITTATGLSTQEFTYVAIAYERAGVVTPVTAHTFLSTPEALWTVV